MCPAVRIAVLVGEVRKHIIENTRVNRCCSMEKRYLRGTHERHYREDTDLHVKVNWPSLAFDVVLSLGSLQHETEHILFESQTHAKPERLLATTYLASA